MASAEMKVVITALLILGVGLYYTTILERSVISGHAVNTDVADDIRNWEEVADEEKPSGVLAEGPEQLGKPARELYTLINPAIMPLTGEGEETPFPVNPMLIDTVTSPIGGLSQLPVTPTGLPPSLKEIFHVDDEQTGCKRLPQQLQKAVGDC